MLSWRIPCSCECPSSRVIEFEKKLLHVLRNLAGDDTGSPTMIWIEIMGLVPFNLHPDYQDRVAFETALTCLICLGTNYILDEDKSVNVAGLVVETAMYIEAMSGNDPGSVNHLDYQSRLNEIIKNFHKQNG